MHRASVVLSSDAPGFASQYPKDRIQALLARTSSSNRLGMGRCGRPSASLGDRLCSSRRPWISTDECVGSDIRALAKRRPTSWQRTVGSRDQVGSAALRVAPRRTSIPIHKSEPPPKKKPHRVYDVNNENFSPTLRNSTPHCMPVASRLSTRTSKTTSLGAFRTPRASRDPCRNSTRTGEGEDHGTACVSAQRHSRRRC